MPFMKILLNGNVKRLDQSLSSLGRLIAHLQLKPDQIVVEINKKIIPRNQYENTELKNDDEIEVVQMLGGG